MKNIKSIFNKHRDKPLIKMSIKLKQYYMEEITKFSIALNHNDFKNAWHHLERAHILGQRYLLPHLYIHFQMLKLACREKRIPEIIGQALRLGMVFPGFLSGKTPIGNPGTTRVALTAIMPIPKDLLQKLDD